MARSAQDAYKIFVNEHLSPALRERGFKGSSGAYELPSDVDWLLLGLQKSGYSDSDDIRFTANLLAVRRDHWEAMRSQDAQLGRKPRAGTLYGPRVELARLGRLASDDDSDTWWQLSPDADLAELNRRFLADLDVFGLPWLETMAAR